MTDAQSAQTALDKLIEAVEAGTLTGDDDLSYPAGVPEMIDTALGMDTVWDTVCLAHEGSLDAAFALHEVLLPGWRARLDIGQRNRCWMISPGNRKLDAYSSTPARAWLLAVLRAYRSGEQQ